MTSSATRREADTPFGEWADSMEALMTYRYLASRPRLIDGTHAEGLMEIRPDLRTPAGAVLGAPLVIAMLDVAGITVDRHWILALTQINVEVLDAAVDVGEVYLSGQITTAARSQIFTEARIYDATDRDRVVGFGTANWSVICPTPEGFQYPDPGRGIEGLGRGAAAMAGLHGPPPHRRAFGDPGPATRNRYRPTAPWTDAGGQRGGCNRGGDRSARHRCAGRGTPWADDRCPRPVGSVRRDPGAGRGPVGHRGMPHRVT